MKHTRNEVIKARLAIVRGELEGLTTRLRDDILDWAPAAEMRTISGQLVEIIGTEMQLLGKLKGEPFLSDDEARKRIGDCGSVTNLKQWLEESRRQTLAHLDALSESELAEEISFGVGWHASLGLSSIPRAEIFINIASHEWYHVGQLISYLWARGDDPYRW